MIAICPIEMMIAVGPAGDETHSAELGQFLLNGAKSQSAYGHQLAHVTLGFGRGEEQSQNLRARRREQDLQNFR